ncbi:MAG: efflux RND transporter periplasmic adaptor subunit [Chitinophagaceae bacterium]
MQSLKIKGNYLIIFLILGALLFSCKSKKTNGQKTEESYYTCPMHHQIHADKPGNCPICGMKLILVSRTERGSAVSLDSSLIDLVEPATSTVAGSFKTIQPLRSNLPDTISASGFIGFDPRKSNTVSLLISGRIEKIFVHYFYQYVQKGQPIMILYSPELLSAQRDFLQAVSHHDQALTSSLKENLLNLGMDESEIQKVIQTRAPITDVTIYSPYSGIINQLVENPQENGMTNTMNPSILVGDAYSKSSINLHQGMYVMAGEGLFSIQNIQSIWAILNIFTTHIEQIKIGDPVNLFSEANPVNIIKGSVDFIPPELSQNSNTSQIRVYLDKVPENWKIGTLIHGNIIIPSLNGSAYIPLLAVNRLGLHNVVWVEDAKNSNIYHARQIKTGISIGDSVEVISGIHPGEKIVANASYMVGSESFIQ